MPKQIVGLGRRRHQRLQPPFYVRRKRLSMQYSLKLSSTAQNPAYSVVFNGKFKSAFHRKPNQIPLYAFELNRTCMSLALSRKISFPSSTGRTANIGRKCTLKHVLVLVQYPNRCSSFGQYCTNMYVETRFDIGTISKPMFVTLG